MKVVVVILLQNKYWRDKKLFYQQCNVAISNHYVAKFI